MKERVYVKECLILICTHLIRKFVVNKGRGAVFMRDKVDHRVRRKSKDRQSNTHFSTMISYVNAKATPILCTGDTVTNFVLFWLR